MAPAALEPRVKNVLRLQLASKFLLDPTLEAIRGNSQSFSNSHTGDITGRQHRIHLAPADAHDLGGLGGTKQHFFHLNLLTSGLGRTIQPKEGPSLP